MRRAQVSLFVILGIVLVVSTALFVTLRGRVGEQSLQPVSEAGAQLPNEFSAVQPFVESCLEKTAKEAGIRLGERGGYIYTEALSPESAPTEGDAMRMSRGSTLILPYWFYLESANSCQGRCAFTSARLPLTGGNSVETQIERYVDEHLGACLGGFRSFTDLGFEVKPGEWKTKAVVGASDVAISLDFPLTVTRGGSKETFRQFSASLDVPLRDIYTLAQHIADTEKDYRFLERATLNLIVGFSGRDSQLLPPLADSTFTLSPGKRWVKSQVKQRIQGILTSYIPLIRMSGTPGFSSIETDSLLSDKLYGQMVIPNNSSVSDVEVSFLYLDFWDPYFDLNCDGEICKPEESVIDILPIGVQRYNFVYDLSFPALVELRSAEAFNSEGYTFSFLLESNIRRNAPLPALYQPIPGIEDEFGTQLCDADKRTSGAIAFTIKDKATRQPLSDVDISYSCIESCVIGTAQNGALSSRLPLCLGGTLSFRKDGYVTVFQRFDARLDEPGQVEAELAALKELQVDVRKRMLQYRDGQWKLAGEQPLEEGDTAVITLTQKNGAASVSFEAKPGEPFSVQLAEGLYAGTVDLFTEKRLVIPERTLEFEDEKVKVDRIEQEGFASGSASFTYSITSEDLSHGKLVLSVLSPDILGIPLEERQMGHLNILNKLDDESYAEQVRPRFE